MGTILDFVSAILGHVNTAWDFRNARKKAKERR
jgi:hypothetical protein